MKITITRLLETAKYLSMPVESAFKDLVVYLAEFVEQTVRSLRGGLTFVDNFDAKVSSLELKHDTAQVVAAERAVKGVLITRVYSSSSKLDAFTWYYDDGNRLTFKASFTGSPTAAVKVDAVLLYG